jgi:hypothetical protein
MVLIQEVFANEGAADGYEEHMKDHGLGAAITDAEHVSMGVALIV